MPAPDIIRDRAPVNGVALVRGLRHLGVRDGSVTMVHASLSSLGWVAGGSETVVRALLRAVGEHGTICAQASWEDSPFSIDEWPRTWRRAYEEEPTPFDPVVSEAGHFEGRLAERIRTWPGARRSANPDSSLAAVGARAHWLIEPHAPDDGFGPATPYARLVEAGGDVVLLGAPLHSISLLHHAEALAAVPGKRRVRYRVPLAAGDAVAWRWCDDIDVRRGPVPYEAALGGDVQPLAVIAEGALAAGVGRRAPIAGACCHRFPARELVAFAVRWIETRWRP